MLSLRMDCIMLSSQPKHKHLSMKPMVTAILPSYALKDEHQRPVHSSLQKLLYHMLEAHAIHAPGGTVFI